MYLYIIDELFKNISSANLSDKTKQIIASEIEEYVSAQHNRLRITKNILFRSEPVDFRENYIPLTLKSETNNIRVTDPIRLVKEFSKIGIIGSAGSGKTTLLRYIALKCIEEASYIPVVIELRNYNFSKLSFEDFVSSQINDKYLEEIKSVFKEGKFIFILDGYDEIDYIQGNSFIAQIESFVTKYSSNKFVISSRPGTNVESLLPFYIFSISPLNEDDIFLFIEKLNMPSNFRKKLIHSIKNEHFLKDAFNVPLLLSLYILTFNSFAELPTKKSVFLRNSIDTLFSVHDSVSKLGYVRTKISNLDRESLERISSILAFRTLFSSRYQLTKDELFQEFQLIKKTTPFIFENDKLLYDLTITVNILYVTGSIYSFPHLLILEYLAASFVANLEGQDKINLYERMTSKKSFILSATFLDLLYELDSASFIKYYLVPTLERLIENPIRFKDDEYNNYTQASLIEFIRKNPWFNFVDSTHSGFYISDFEKILEKLKKEMQPDFNDRSNPLFDF